jgi:hypothetical protein
MTAYHFWKIRKNGGISHPDARRKADDEDYTPVDRVTTMPNLVQVEMAAATLVVTLVLIGSMFFPAPLESMANPVESPNPAKAAWYFVGIQELLLHMIPQAAMGLLGVILVAVTLLPYLDARDEGIGIYFRSRVGKRAALLGAFLSVDLVPLLVVADEFWLDLPGWFPGLSEWVVHGFIPLTATLLGLAGIYLLMRYGLRANRSEAAVGLFSFLVVSLILLTVIGYYFRGANMALALPF